MKKQIGFIILVALGLALTGCSTKGSAALTANSWEWASMETTVPASQSVVPNPSSYTIAFNTDGSVSIKADCNQVGGTYVASGSDLTITLGPSTMAYCGDASIDAIYLASLSEVTSYSIANGELTLSFPHDGGQMHFNKGAAQ
jgi:heat shock protein HslJ